MRRIHFLAIDEALKHVEAADRLLSAVLNEPLGAEAAGIRNAKGELHTSRVWLRALEAEKDA
ncbi:hypothetical protein [Tepidimonas sp.]|uniref:hypothetical protein n=1 Tax=Tepidimonas sp. TaxID=2002775 RepID=UPI00391872F9